MPAFQKIVFVSQALTDDVDALKQALDMAHRGNAELSALIVCPEFPPQQATYRERYEASLTQQLDASIQAARRATGIGADELPIRIELESASMPALRIIRQVQRHGFDLVIKQAEHDEGERGFKAVDMELLRKCPSPLWLYRPPPTRAGAMRIAVAIEPQSVNAQAHALSLRLLLLGRSISQHYGSELHIVSCWDFPLEEYLRGNAWIELADDEILETVLETQRHHRAALDKLIGKSAVGGDIRVHHMRGDAGKMIPQFVADQHIGLLVMGTVARTGIPGFVIGNTAENIVRKLDCSLLAAKPNGFVSPVKAC
ncbi:universal stress protein [Massilia scottii]|uniref:universal stress protein n=1 Tax=Massilia scottii TaxID=3057166 RepID=UPI00279642EE|nr:universal stress protein [Massilia sp. CCM 9029]MDQ1833546.1 universal stress protein [Massilia sp. CCM 9029]